MSPSTENRPLNIVVWNENVHETRGDATVIGHYPDGMHTVIAEALRQLQPGADVSTATLQEPELRIDIVRPVWLEQMADTERLLTALEAAPLARTEPSRAGIAN